jgi:hypothetical protein
MSGNDKRKDAAKEIAKRVQERRREKQYDIMCSWRDGLVTGIIALDKIVELESIIEVFPEDFKQGPTPPTATPPGI